MRMEKFAGWKVIVCLAIVAAAVVVVVPRITSLHAQAHARIPLATDWSHRHLVYSTPTSLEQTIRLRQDARYIQQFVRRNVAKETPWAPEAVEQMNAFEEERQGLRRERLAANKIHRDWSENLGGGASVGLNQFPAKFSFDTTTANCATATHPDFVAYNTSVAGAPPAAASVMGTFAANPANGQTVTITNGANVVTLTASNSFATGSVTFTADPGGGDTVTIAGTIYDFHGTSGNCAGGGQKCVQHTGNTTTDATNLSNAIAGNCFNGACGADTHVTATSAGNVTSLQDKVAATNFAISTNDAGAMTVAEVNAGAGSNTGTNFAVGSGAATDATNLAAAINRNNATIGVSAGAAAGVVTVTATAAGTAGNAIAVADTLANFGWNGATLSGGTNGQASVIAYDNLYSGCTGTVPSIYWQYNTGGTVVTSLTLSIDGSQIAFVQTQGGVANLVLLKWKASPSLAVLTAVTPAAYVGCSAPCMTTIAFQGGPTDTNSSGFYVYDGVQSDTLYAGDDNGKLHKFHPVFTAAAAEITTSWPITVNATAGTIMTGPVYDSTSGNIYITDSTGNLSYVRDVGSTVGACTAPCKGGSYDVTLGAGYAIPDSPIVDATSQKVLVFTDCSLSGDAGGTCGDGTSPAQVVQTTTALGSPVAANIGASSLFNNVHVGSFDNNYYSGSYASGRLYACGNPDRFNTPTLYILSFNASGVLNTTVVTGPSIATSGQTNQCSPMTEIYNPNTAGGATDWLFVGVVNAGTPAACAGGGCIMNFNVTAWKASTVYAVGQVVLDTNGNLQRVTTAGTSAAAMPTWVTTNGGVTSDGATLKWTNQGLMAVANSLAASGGTSGIIIDNTVATGTLAGVSQVYYSTLTNATCATSGGTGGCAVQASQAALH